MNTITLYKASTGWVALYRGPHAKKIKRLFGTDTLPTAFTTRATADTVRQAIQALNPTATVITLAAAA